MVGQQLVEPVQMRRALRYPDDLRSRVRLRGQRVQPIYSPVPVCQSNPRLRSCSYDFSRAQQAIRVDRDYRDARQFAPDRTQYFLRPA